MFNTLTNFFVFLAVTSPTGGLSTDTSCHNRSQRVLFAGFWRSKLKVAHPLCARGSFFWSYGVTSECRFSSTRGTFGKNRRALGLISRALGPTSRALGPSVTLAAL